jgi:hypothetical protein
MTQKSSIAFKVLLAFPTLNISWRSHEDVKSRSMWHSAECPLNDDLLRCAFTCASSASEARSLCVGADRDKFCE